MQPRHAVAAGHKLVAEAAARALASGGTAVDACVAGALAACAAEPGLAGLFGGGVLLVREPSGRARLLDFSAQAPARRRADRAPSFRAATAAPDAAHPARALRLGAATIAAPCVAPGLAEAHARLGRLPFAELAAPAIEAARAAPLSAFQAGLLARHAQVFAADPAARALYRPDPDRALRPGEPLRNPALADLLEVFAAEGARFMAEGEPAAMLAELASAGGHLTREDIAGCAPLWRDPTRTRRGAMRLTLPGAPSAQGMAEGWALDLLAPPAPGARPRPADPVALGRALAAVSGPRLDALARSLSRPDPRPDPLPPVSDEAVAAWAALSPRDRAPTDAAAICAVDASGMAAVLMLANGPGCGLIVPGLGVMPNNLLGEIPVPPDAPEARETEFPEIWTPGRRLDGALLPVIVEWHDGTVAALAAAGGSDPDAGDEPRAALLAALSGLLDRGEALDLALAGPRVQAAAVHDPDAARSRPPTRARFEDAFGDPSRDALLSALPEAEPAPAESPAFGAMSGVRRAASGAVEAAVDPRREGASQVG